MSYSNNLGGLHGFGPVPGTDDDANFHAAWEARVFVIARSLVIDGLTTWDGFRHAVERMPPEDYLRTPYYERWFHGILQVCVDAGRLSEAERAVILAAGESP